MKPIRAVFALVAHLNLQLHQMDFITAFMSGDIEEDLYMKIRDGVERI